MLNLNDFNVKLVTFLPFSVWQITTIKDKVKEISNLVRDITKYVDDGKDEYKEVTCLLLSYVVHCDSPLFN